MAADLVGKLGIEFPAGNVRFRGWECGPRTGLVVVVPDPDGHGTLALYTGANADCVWGGFTVNTSTARHAFTLARDHRIFVSEDLAAAGTSGPDLRKPVVLRLDREFAGTGNDGKGEELDERARRIAARLEAYQGLYSRAGAPRMPLDWIVRDMLSNHADETERAIQLFGNMDLRKQILGLSKRCEKLAGGREGAQPAYFVMLYLSDKTNAQTFDADRNGRPQVLLNLCAFRTEQELMSAVAHETFHTLQGLRGNRLLDKAIHEGVATWLAQQAVPDTPDHMALMWTEEKLRAAEERRDGILRAFRAAAPLENSPAEHDFMLLHRPLRSVPGAPDRCAYYVGWLAVRAWREKNPAAPPSALLHASPGEIFAALD